MLSHPLSQSKYIPPTPTHLDVSVPILTRVNEWVKFQESSKRFIHGKDGRIALRNGGVRQGRSAVIQSFLDFLYECYRSEQSFLYKIAKYKRPSFIGLILCISHSRTFSVINGYGAPLKIYKHFGHHYDDGT
ncbi:hypothetical protein Tco_0162053, partial [Tanacetum coccineum]